MCKQCPDEGYCSKCGEPQGDEREILLDEWQDQIDGYTALGYATLNYTAGGNPNSHSSNRSPIPST